MSAPKAEKANVTLMKLEVAVWQLDIAIRLFLEGDYLSSLTLAGAAEEILGRLCEREGMPIAVEAIIAHHWGDTDPAITDKERRAILLGILNRPRNEAKHANNPDETYFVVEQDFPLQMIMRAMPMAQSLGLHPSGEAKMVAWIRAYLNTA